MRATRGPAGLPERTDALDTGGQVFIQGRQDAPAGLAVQVGACRLNAALFGAGDGMPRHELADFFTQAGPRRCHHILLGAAGIGKQGSSGARCPAIRATDVGHGAHRQGQQDHIGIGDGGFAGVSAMASMMPSSRAFSRLARPRPQPTTWRTAPACFSVQGDRAADQADADDGQP
jgi:hypothetical protein